jgi:prepilin-type N-terminal cleavage/methylation domain-containing protein
MRKRGGFTLIELLVVIAIIALGFIFDARIQDEGGRFAGWDQQQWECPADSILYYGGDFSGM